MSQPVMHLPPLLQALADERVEVVIIGGFAAVALGVPYVTQDIDFCYNPDPANIQQLVRALLPFHPRLRIEGMSDAEARVLPFQLDAITLAQVAILNLQLDIAEVDLMSSVKGVGDYHLVFQAAIEIDLFGYHFAVLDLPGLIAAKQAANRPKDRAMLPQIEATLRLRERQP